MMQSEPAYDDRPIPQTHLSVMVRAARGRSLQPPAISTARVLEVGCAHGVNSMAMAARLPDASFVGIDVDARAIETASRRAREAELGNIRFEAADVREFRTDDVFDYVIAHGVVSWVPHAVADAVFALIARVLAPDGLAYVSYDAKPGACMREAIGLGLRAASDHDATLFALQTSPALADSPQGAWLAAEVESARDRPRSYRHQQFLGEQHAFSVGDVWEWSERHALHYIDDVAETGLPGDVLERTRAAIAGLATDRKSLEQVFDVAIMRQFRATILARHAAGPEVWLADEPVMPCAVPNLPRARPLSRVEARELGFVSTDAQQARAVHALHRLLIEHCDGARDHATLGRIVIEAVRNGVLELPTQAGTPATAREVEEGIDLVLGPALAELAQAGVIV